MKSLKKFFGRRSIAIFGFIVLQSAFGQTSIQGSIQDTEEKPLSYVNVLLLSASDSILVKGAITDDTGGFLFEDILQGRYVITASIVGFETQTTEIIALEDTEIFTIPPILLQEGVLLDEVVVKSIRPLYETFIDRTVVNVKNSITSTGSTVLEVLEKSPGVVVNRQTNSISMKGKTGVLVMINNKVNRMPMDAVVQMLNGMGSASIEKIELITVPPAKYDAEGDAGIIHIIMSGSEDVGTNGSFGVNTGYNGGGSWGVNFNVNHSSERLHTFISYSINSNHSREEGTNDHFTIVDGFTRSNSGITSYKPVTTVQNLRLGLVYDITKKTTTSLLLTGYERYWRKNAPISNRNIISPDSTIFTDVLVFEKNQWRSATASLGLEHRLDESQTIDLSFDYLFYRNDQITSFDNKTFFSSSATEDEELIETEKRTPINFKVFNLDYTNEIKENFNLDLGAKASFSTFDNDVNVTNTKENETAINPDFSSFSTLVEKIWAAYGSLKWQPNATWDISGGLRYEHTDTFLESLEEGVLVNRNFGNFFSSIFISKSLGENSKLNLSYNRRVSRPTYNDLAPFIIFLNPNTFLSGNLTLRPAISDGAELGYELKKWWISLKYSYAKDAIAPFQPAIDVNTNRQISRPENLKYLQSFGINTSLPIKITSWWQMRTDAAIYFNSYSTKHLENDVTDNIVNFTGNTVNSFLLPKDFSLEITGNYQSASFWGTIKMEPTGRLDIGLKKQLKDNKGTLSLVGNDLFATTILRGSTNIPEENIRSFWTYDLGIRSIVLSYSKAFGNKKLNAIEIDSGAEEERKRVN